MFKDFECVILSACRTPIGAFGGALKDVSAPDLGAAAIREAIAAFGDGAEEIALASPASGEAVFAAIAALQRRAENDGNGLS